MIVPVPSPTDADISHVPRSADQLNLILALSILASLAIMCLALSFMFSPRSIFGLESMEYYGGWYGYPALGHRGSSARRKRRRRISAIPKLWDLDLPQEKEAELCEQRVDSWKDLMVSVLAMT